MYCQYAARDFNDKALKILKDHLSGTSLMGYDAAKAKIQEILNGMLLEKEVYGDYLTQETLDWAMGCNTDEVDKNILSLVITYLLSKGDDALKTWLSTFLEESKHAYSNSQNSQSCVKGAKERVVTSLRNLTDSPEKLVALIKKTENELLLPFKISNMGTEQIIPQLKAYGLKSSMNEDEAEKAYLMFLTDVYFEEDMDTLGKKEVQDAINVTIDLFKGKGGFWEKWEPKLKEMEEKESGGASAAADGSAPAASATGGAKPAAATSDSANGGAAPADS